MMCYTIDGVTLTEAQVEERLVREREARLSRLQPVVKQVYRRKETTDADPQNGWMLLRYNGGTSWSSQSNGQEWRASWWPHDQCVAALQRGDLVPYVPPAPTFAAGDWVQRRLGPWPKAQLVVEVDSRDATVRRDGTGWIHMHLVRHATPEEVTAAKVIVPVVGLLLKRNTDGAVLRCKTNPSSAGHLWHADRLDQHNTGSYREVVYVRELTTDHYTVLDRYTVEGAR